jgi:hypothetical protein
MKVRNLDELRAMRDAGTVKRVEGVHFAPPQPKDTIQSVPQAPQPVAPQQDLSPLVAAITQAMANQSALSNENMRQIAAILMQQQAAPAATIPGQKRWTFRVERNEDGFVSQIVAESE